MTHNCLIGYAGPDECKKLTREDLVLLRTKESYANDILKINPSVTGVKSECVFNNVDGYHVIDNFSANIMQDCMKGAVNYVLTEVLIRFVNVDRLFSISYLNDKLNAFDFGDEARNRPLEIDMSYVMKNHKLKMSAAEMLLFTKYFGFLVGEVVPPDNDVWKLYKLLRHIIDIITSPVITNTDIFELEMLV